MLRNTTIILALAFIGFSSCQPLDPCSSPEAFVKSHTKFVEETITGADDLSENEWKEKDKAFEEMMDTCFEKLEDDLSKREKEEIATNSAKYLAKRVKNSVGFSFENLADNLENVFNDDFEQSVERIGSEFGKNMEDLFDEDFQNKIEDIFDEDFKRKMEDLFDDEFKSKIEDIFDEEFKEDLKSTFEDLGKELEGFGEKLKDILEESSDK